MAIQFFTDISDGRRCILVNGTTERAYPIGSFDSVEDAESFVEWTRHHGGLAAFNAASLGYLRNAWEVLPKCADCRRVLEEGRCGECGGHAELDDASNG